jgi:hypothetical protein
LNEKSPEDDWRRYFFLVLKSGVAESTYQALKTRFIKWAIPDTMKVPSKIATLIEPREFLEVANMNHEKDEAKEPESP